MKIASRLVVPICILMITILSDVKAGQNALKPNIDYLSIKIKSFKVHSEKFHIAIEKFASEYKIPIGIVVNDIIILDERYQLVTVELVDTTVM